MVGGGTLRVLQRVAPVSQLCRYYEEGTQLEHLLVTITRVTVTTTITTVREGEDQGLPAQFYCWWR